MIKMDQQKFILFVVPGVTILLSQTVFSLLVGHVITKTSEAVPLLGRIVIRKTNIQKLKTKI